MSCPRPVWLVGAGFLGSRVAQLSGALRLDCQANAEAIGDGANTTFLQQLAARYGTPQTLFCCQATRGGAEAAYEHAYLHVLQAFYGLWPHLRIIFCSSASVLGARQGQSCDESFEPQISTKRAQILWQAERMVLARAGVVARMPALYGKGRCALFERFMQGLMPVAGAPTRLLNYLHRDDAAEALCLLAQEGEGLYHLVGECWRKEQILAQLAEWTQRPAPHEENAPSSPRRGASHYRLASKRSKEWAWGARRRMKEWVHKELS